MRANKHNLFSKRSISIIALLTAVFLFAVYQLLWGKLLPYSPITPGFSKHDFSNVVFYVQEGAAYDEFQNINGLFPAIEKFHELNFKEKPRIYIFRDDESYRRHSITKARFNAYPNGSIIVAPWAVREAKEGILSLEIYLTHELSHTLLYQNMGSIAAYIYYPRWLLEGIAVYSSHQMGTSWYPSKAETYELIKQGNFMPPELFNTRKEEQVSLNAKYKIAFIYSELGCFVDYLVTAYGRDKFIEYMKIQRTTWDHNQAFKSTYQIDLEKGLLDFKNQVNERSTKEFDQK
jgi:hypothetical protein